MSRERVLRTLRSVDNVALGRFLQRMMASALARRTVSRSESLRKLVEAFLPCDPLADVLDPPPIELVIPCHADDAELLELVVWSALQSSRNPIAAVTLVTPTGAAPALGELGVPVTVRSDLEIVGRELLDLIDELVPQWRRGWVVQQVVKLRTVSRSTFDGCLAVDADTVLLRSRTWLSADGRQILAVPHEFHEPYVEHAARVWGLPRPAVSFVTHHQLIQSRIVREMFGMGTATYERWLRAGDWTEDSAIAEYHDLGAWLSEHHRDDVVLVRWRNRFGWRDQLPRGGSVGDRRDLLRARFPHDLSVSFHAHGGAEPSRVVGDAV